MFALEILPTVLEKIISDYVCFCRSSSTLLIPCNHCDNLFYGHVECLFPNQKCSGCKNLFCDACSTQLPSCVGCEEKLCEENEIGKECATCHSKVCSGWCLGLSYECAICQKETCYKCAYKCPVRSCRFEGCEMCTRNHFWKKHLSSLLTFDMNVKKRKRREKKAYPEFEFSDQHFWWMNAQNKLTD